MAGSMAELTGQRDALESSAPDQGSERLDGLIEAIRRVFAEKGFDRASMQDLARAAEMSAGNFYRYFPSKDAIIEALVRRELAEIEAQFQQVMQAEDPLQRLTQILHAQLDSFDQQDCAIWMEVLVSARRQEPIGRLYESLMASITDYLVMVFARLRDMPVAEARLRFGAFAEMIFMLVQGVHLQRIRREGSISPQVLELAHRTLDLYLSEISQVCASWCGHNSQGSVHA